MSQRPANSLDVRGLSKLNVKTLRKHKHLHYIQNVVGNTFNNHLFSFWVLLYCIYDHILSHLSVLKAYCPNQTLPEGLWCGKIHGSILGYFHDILVLICILNHSLAVSSTSTDLRHDNFSQSSFCRRQTDQLGIRNHAR